MTGAESGTCVISGATSGMGLETVRQLAAGGMTVIGLGRGPESCRRAEADLGRSDRRAGVRFLAADLSSLANVRRAAAAIRKELPGGRLDRLVHNAVALPSRYIGTEDGYELQFVVNYLAAFLLTRELWPALVRRRDGRVIAVSSGSHRQAEICWTDPMLRRRYSALRAYRQSKLALVLFTRELNRRVAHRFPLRAIGVEPGLVDTAIGGPRLEDRGLSPADAATSIVRLALEPSSSITADYWRLGRPAEPSAYARSAEAALRLWRLSEKLAGADFL
ncbi:MAG TPA: SDR family NAD(P)-dependent oxidoreductase [Acidobacteriota bacterium]|nr:SDR family NAD(P)-dependent oxidoreductase [Acidobacteriota bacterium]